MAELIGWGSALLLLPAFALQTYRQWKNRDEPETNPSAFWFFVLVLVGTAGQVAYSWMVGNWVYLALNSALVVNNGVGLGIAIRRRQVRAHHSLP
jgi:MtN3 and saliva related transmembrane protein